MNSAPQQLSKSKTVDGNQAQAESGSVTKENIHGEKVSVIWKIARYVYRLLFRIFKGETILVLGDSHIWVFYHWWFKVRLPTKTFEICAVRGATASGLENPDSKTQAGEEFDVALSSRKFDKRIIVLLGEVDTGFVIWYRAVKYNAAVSEMLNQAIMNYGQLLSKAKQYGDVVVISTPLPTIEDGNDWGDVAISRREIKATLRERMALTLEFNQAIDSYCKENGMTFIPLDSKSLGDDGLVHVKLRNKNPLDHHYDPFNYARLLASKLSRVL